MLLPRFFTLVLGILLTISAGTVFSQTYPHKPIRIVTGGIGSSSDVWARLTARGLTAALGQAVIVDNRGGGVTGQEAVAKASPDGHTLAFYSSIFWLAPLLLDKLSYDPIKDFAPITTTESTPALLCVQPSLPAKSVAELIALAKAKPGELNYGSSGAGSPPHLAAEFFNAMAGVKTVRISYKGIGAALNALIAGEVQMVFASPGSSLTHIKAGRLRALAVTSAQPSALLPGVPPVAASGLPGYASVTTSGFFAPAKTPTPIINRLNQEIVRYLSTAEVKERLFNMGLEAVVSTPQQFAATVKSEMTQMGKVIKDAGIRAE